MDDPHFTQDYYIPQSKKEKGYQMKSFLDCKHERVQQFTECCLDCGYNIWTTEKEYLQDLRRKAGKTVNRSEIRKLEKQLGIGEQLLEE